MTAEQPEAALREMKRLMSIYGPHDPQLDVAPSEAQHIGSKTVWEKLEIIRIGGRDADSVTFSEDDIEVLGTDRMPMTQAQRHAFDERMSLWDEIGSKMLIGGIAIGAMGATITIWTVSWLFAG